MAKRYLLEDREEEDITEEAIWDMVYFEDETNWTEELERLIDFFNDSIWILVGRVGKWNGTFDAGYVFTDFKKMFYKANKDCVYWKFWDENGHLYYKCTHHDGTNCFEIKKLTDKGEEYLDNWAYGTDNRTEQYVHNQIMKRYSVLPRFVETVYGCARVEYEKEGK